MLLNRGGKGKYKLSYAYLDMGGREYVIENHLICIRVASSPCECRSDNVVRLLGDERTSRFIELYLSNNAINTMELVYITDICVRW